MSEWEKSFLECWEKYCGCDLSARDKIKSFIEKLLSSKEKEIEELKKQLADKEILVNTILDTKNNDIERYKKVVADLHKEIDDLKEQIKDLIEKIVECPNCKELFKWAFFEKQIIE